MTTARRLCVLLLGVLAAVGLLSAPAGARPHLPPPLAQAHAHNDYEHPRLC